MATHVISGVVSLETCSGHFTQLNEIKLELNLVLGDIALSIRLSPLLKVIRTSVKQYR